ncbi:hypothetical protein M9Y10_030253 [Tritrichomonas musculus]|uniref:Uncharacterized protein n=1 Tax=Tritrichomonas musculus TaxID=1915356 RepID=A0ABR2KQ91_9EUKA
MNDIVSLKFGIFNDFTIPFKFGSINSVFPINYRECLCSTTKNLYKIEKNEIKMTNNKINLAVSLLIPDTDILVGVSTRTNKIFVYQTTNLSQPIISNYPTNHLGVYHIYYSPKSSSLILVGYGIKVYYLKLKYDGNRHSIFPPDVKIKFRSKFCDDYSPNLLLPAPFDSDHEYIFLPAKEGICPYDLDGNKKDPVTKFPASIATVYFYNEFSKRIFTFDHDHGLIKWTPSGQIDQRFPSAGTSIVAMFLIDNENIVCYNSSKQVFLFNFVTCRTFFCYNLERKPTRLILIKTCNRPHLIVCQGATLIGLRIEIPWNVWSHPLLDCSLVGRCDQIGEAGRIFVQIKGNIIDLYSPSKGKLLTSATQKKAVSAVSFLYDRGIVQYSKKSYSKYELVNIQINPLENSTIYTDTDIINENKTDLLSTRANSVVNNKYDILSTRTNSVINEKSEVLSTRANSIINDKTEILSTRANSIINDKTEILSTRANSIINDKTEVLNTRANSFLNDSSEFLITRVDAVDYNENSESFNVNAKNKSEEKSFVHPKLKDSHRDILYFVFEDGTVSGFFTGVSPCEEILNLSLKANFLCVVFYDGRWCYAALSKGGILSIYDYVTFSLLMQTSIGYLDVIKLFYDILSQSLVIVNGKTTMIYDLQNKRISDQLDIEGSDVVSLFGDFVKFGYKTGHITTVYIEKGHFKTDSIIDKRSHSNEVTGFSFSPEFWISSSLDCNLLAWNYHEEKIFQIMLPLPLKACCIINGRRDILVATDSEVMKVGGDNFFLSFDDEISEIDNYDKLCDYLEMPHYLTIADMMRKTKSKLASSKKKPKSKNNDSILVSDINISNKANLNSSPIIEKFNVLFKTPQKVHTTTDNEKILQSMMELNGIKSPVVPKFKIQSFDDKKTEKKEEKDTSQEKVQKIVNEEVKSNSPKKFKKAVSGKDFLKSEIEKEKKFQMKPKKPKRKKKNSNKENIQKVDAEETKPAKNSLDLLSQMDRSKSDKLTKKADIQKKESTIDIAALAKLFQKVEDENENQHEYEYVSDSETESDSGKKKKKKSAKAKKEKSKKLLEKETMNEYESESENETENVHEKTKKSAKTKKEKSKKLPEKVNLSDDKKTVKSKTKSGANKAKPETPKKSIAKSKIKPYSSSLLLNEKEPVSHENSLLQSRGIQRNSIDENDDNNRQLSGSSHSSSKRKVDLTDIEEEEEAKNEESLENNKNDVFYVKEEEEDNGINEPIEENRNSNDTDEIKEEEEAVNEAENESCFDKEAAATASDTKSEISPKKNSNVNSIKKSKESSYRPSGQIKVQLKKTEEVKEVKKRASTPDPQLPSRSKIRTNQEQKIRRSFSCRPRRTKNGLSFEYDLDNIDEIPANIWIDENALFEKYSIRRTQKEGRKRKPSPLELSNGVFFEDRPNSNSKEKTVKVPQKTNSNFFRRKNISSKRAQENDLDNESEIDKTVNRLALRQYQLHQIQKCFEYNLADDEFNGHENDRNQTNNHSQIFDNNNNNNKASQNFQYFTSSSHSQNLNEDKNRSIKVYGSKINEDNNININNNKNDDISKQLSFEISTSPQNIKDNEVEDQKEVINEPSLQNSPKSPRRFSKPFSKKNKDKVHRNFSRNLPNNGQEVDQLEQAFLRKIPNFEMKKSTNGNNGKKRPSSSRRISKPKLYLNPVYPPNRSRGIEGAVVKSSFSNINYY